MTFANPYWLWALLLLPPLLALRVRAQISTRRHLKGLVAPRLFGKLVSETSQARHWLAFVFTIFGITGVILAMARPQWGFEEIESYSEGRSIMLAVDTSRSMLATDLAPNRLERAKLAARDIVNEMNRDRIGVLAFAGKAYLQAPLTTDRDAVVETINQIDTNLIPRGGTNLSAAVRQALDAFREAESKQKALIIFSDGEALEGQSDLLDIKEMAKREKMVIITVGVGTDAGEIIPDPDSSGAFIRDESGKVVRSRLDSSALRELASGGGIYIQLGDRGSLTSVVNSITRNLRSTELIEKSEQRPIERFIWPLSFGLFFLVCSHMVHLLFRSKFSSGILKPAVAALIVSVCISSTGFSADGWNYLEKQDYATALKEFETFLEDQPEMSRKEETMLYMGMGTAAYRIGNYERAAYAFGKALIRPTRKNREQAHYNLGNTLYRLGESYQETDVGGTEPVMRQWLGALEHFEAVLTLNPSNVDAKHNIELIRRKLASLKTSEPPPNQGNNNQSKSDPEKSDSEKEDNQNSQNDSPPEEPQDNDEQDQTDSQNSGSNSESPQNGEAQSEPPQEGKLEANNSQSSNRSDSQREAKVNPDTGYSPDEARQLIDSLADENAQMRTAYPQAVKAERYKNW